MTNEGGYQNLLVYQLATAIFDLTVNFCRVHLANRANGGNRAYEPNRRTIEQMTQAARSGKQNIVEGSLERSLKSYVKLLGVARGSFGELLEDYKDFLRVEGLNLWDKNDPRVLRMRTAKTNWADRANQDDLANGANPEGFANRMMTLLNQENYLLDQLIKKLERKFVEEGGYSENLTKKRKAYLSNLTNSSNLTNEANDRWLKERMGALGYRQTPDGRFVQSG